MQPVYVFEFYIVGNIRSQIGKFNLQFRSFTPCGPGSSVGIATELRAGGSGIESQWGRDFSARPDRPWGPPSLLQNGYRVYPGGKVRPGRAADHSPPSSAVVMEE